MENPKLVVVCGWPLAGKGTIAKLLAERTNFHWIDIDEVRRLNFGIPDPHPDRSTEATNLDVAQMTGSYQLLCAATQHNLAMGRSTIISGTFSRQKYWDWLERFIGEAADVKIVWCRPYHDDDAEINKRLKGRIFGVNCFSSVNSLKRYDEVKDRFVAPPISYSCIEINTSPPNTPEACANSALEYVSAPTKKQFRI